MKMRNYTIILACLFTLINIFTSCNKQTQKETQEEEQTVIEINLLPMYGSTPEYGSLQKTPEQLEADSIFLENSDKIQPDRSQACIDYIEMGWNYLDDKDWETAMRRANQAWQLDNQNPDVYTLFAAILNMHEAHNEALDMLERAIKIDPSQINLYDIYLSESVDLHEKTQDNSRILKLVNMLDHAQPTDEVSELRVKILKEDLIEYLKQK